MIENNHYALNIVEMEFNEYPPVTSPTLNNLILNHISRHRLNLEPRSSSICISLNENGKVIDNICL